MTISPKVTKSVKTNIPQQPPPGAQAQEPEKVIVLSMNRNGVIKINQTEVEPSHLTEELQEIFKSRSDRTIFVQADDDLLFNDVAHLIDAAKGSGVEVVGLMTDQITVR